MYEQRIKHLEEAHRALDKKIDTLEKTCVFQGSLNTVSADNDLLFSLFN